MLRLTRKSSAIWRRPARTLSIGFPTREPPPPKAKASIQLQSTPAQLKREPSPLVFYPPHRLSAFRTGGDARDLGIMELCAEPQQRLTQLHRARACCSRKREENSPWPPPVSAAICLTSASTIVPGDESTFRPAVGLGVTSR